MNQRERVLSSVVVAVIVGYGGYVLVKTQLYDPREVLKESIRAERQNIEKLELRLGGADERVDEWRERTRATLGTDVTAAHAAFREDVALLLDRNKLTQGRRIAQRKESREKKGPREDFVELPLAVNVEGTLADLDNFLEDLAQRPYFVRVDKLELRAEHRKASGGRRGRDASADTEPQLAISLTLSTLLLPETKNVAHPTMDLEALNSPADPQTGEPVLAYAERLQEPDLTAYDEVAKVNLFKLFVEPKKVVVKTPDPPKEDKKDPPPVVKNTAPPPDPRRNAHKFVLEGVGVLDDGPIAYVINTDEPTSFPDTYRLNDEVDDGRLVLIVPDGIVVRVAASAGRHREPAKNYFYKLGDTFKQRVEVNPSEHAEIAKELSLVLRK
ncbi:GspMb/PilO family protein [uncultured Ilyobacter sp.]|uniref:GspMb/PilO family protein n=1 Tax=uncultured Ilyobacter sp. TaxID=544433 RepID=UPI0029F577EB|nr:GspMb/PilO family protein [uncultured Ilyobacter sp.]